MTFKRLSMSDVSVTFVLCMTFCFKCHIKCTHFGLESLRDCILQLYSN